MHKVLVLLALLSIAYGYPTAKIETNENNDNMVEKIYRAPQTSNPKEVKGANEEITDAEVDHILEELEKYLNATDSEELTTGANDDDDSDKLSDAAIEAVMDEFSRLLLLMTDDAPAEEQDFIVEEVFKKLDELLTNFKQNEITNSVRENKDVTKKISENESDQTEVPNTTPEPRTTEMTPDVVVS